MYHKYTIFVVCIHDNDRLIGNDPSINLICIYLLHTYYVSISQCIINVLNFCLLQSRQSVLVPLVHPSAAKAESVLSISSRPGRWYVGGK